MHIVVGITISIRLSCTHRRHLSWKQEDKRSERDVFLSQYFGDRPYRRRNRGTLRSCPHPAPKTGSPPEWGRSHEKEQIQR